MAIADACTNFTLSGYLISKLEEAREFVKDKLGNPVMPTVDLSLITSKPDVSSLLSEDSLCAVCALSDTWTGDMFNIEWSTIRTILIENINRICVKAKETVDEIINNVPALILEKLIDSLFSIIEEFINSVIKPIDDVILKVMYMYNYIIKMWRDLKKIAKQVREGTVDESQKKEALKKLINEISKLDENIATVLTLIFFSSTLVDILEAVKNLKSTTKGAWNRVIDEIKDQYEMLGDLTKAFSKGKLMKTLFTLLGVLLPILASLAAALLCSNQTDAQIRQSAASVRDEELNANGINPDDLDGTEEEKKLESLYSNLSILLEYGLKNIYGYSLNYNEEGEVINENDVDQAVAASDTISICPCENLSDSLEKDFEEAEKPIRYVLELGKDLSNGYFTVYKGSKISNDQVIGYYQNIPIKSKVAGTVIDKKAKHIIVESDSTIDNIANECENIADNLDFTDKYSPIVDKFKKFANIERFLSDFALPCRIPNVMLHSQKETFLIMLLLGNLKVKAINDYKYKLLDQYTEKSNEAINNYKYKIKDTCSADNVRTSCENNENDKLKDKIFSIKKQGIKDIINFYKTGIQKISRNSIDSDTSYLLVSDYINYLCDTSFDYDDDNEYVIELFNTINNFIKDRLKAESINKQDLITEFNARCKDLLSAKIRTSDYYNYFSRQFSYDWYVQDDDNIIGISKSKMNSDESYDSLYKKMYNYIVNLIGSKDIARDNATIDYENITDPKAFVNSSAVGTADFTEEEQKTIENQNKAKAITKYFMIIRNLSTNNYRTSNIVNLKNKTQSEANTLDKLINKVIAEYNKPEFANFYDNIDKVFDEFKQINCPYDGTIYINNYPHEHFVYSCITDTQMNPYNANATDDELLDRLSCKTAYTPFQLPYWLIYCAEATLINVLIPLYWSTGLLIMGAPLLLPIIYLPIYFLSGSVSVLFGLGICGIAIWPMMVFINNTAYNSTVILPITMAMDFIKRKLREMGNMGMKTLTISAKPLILACDAEIYQLEEELDNTNIQISQLKNNIAGVDATKVPSIEIPDINISNTLSNKVNAILSSISLQDRNNNSAEKEVMAEDGLYHNVVVCLDPAGGKSEQENKSPFTANGLHPSGWEKTKTPDEDLMKFNEYKWSLEICNQIKPQLEAKGIKVFITNTGSAQPKSRCLKTYNHQLTSTKHHIMVSIAVNSSDPDDKQWKSGDSGWSIYTAKKADNVTYYQDSVELAEYIYDNAITKFISNDMNLKTNLGENWIGKKNDYYKKYKIRHAEENYTVVLNAPEQNGSKQCMPSVLSKNFYCDNIDDLKYLNSSAGKADIAIVHVNGILNFIDYKGWS